jgi:hypothetical protein
MHSLHNNPAMVGIGCVKTHRLPPPFGISRSWIQSSARSYMMTIPVQLTIWRSIGETIFPVSSMDLRDLRTMSLDSMGDTLRLIPSPHNGMHPFPQLEQPSVGRKSRPWSDQRWASLSRSTRRCSILAVSDQFFFQTPLHFFLRQSVSICALTLDE